MSDFYLPEKYKKIIAIDFDGTIVKWNEPPKIGQLQEGVKEALIKFKKMGFYIVINSCRFNNSWVKDTGLDKKQQIELVRNFLDNNEIVYDEIDTGDNGKVVAHYYIDDRNIEFDEIKGWGHIINKVKRDDI